MTRFIKVGIRCIICGEPAWGTLGEAMKEKGIPDDRMDDVILRLRDHVAVR